MHDLKEEHGILNEKISEFITGTNVSDLEDKKRSLNYLKWLVRKTNLVQQENIFTIPPAIDPKIVRGSVVWVEFGFNLGREFGGRHPALIWRRTGESIYVIPLSSQRPALIKQHHVKVDKVYGFSTMDRWCNVLKIQNISIIRIDTTAAIGNVKGYVLDAIGAALVRNSYY